MSKEELLNLFSKYNLLSNPKKIKEPKGYVPFQTIDLHIFDIFHNYQIYPFTIEIDRMVSSLFSFRCHLKRLCMFLDILSQKDEKYTILTVLAIIGYLTEYFNEKYMSESFACRYAVTDTDIILIVHTVCELRTGFCINLTDPNDHIVIMNGNALNNIKHWPNSKIKDSAIYCNTRNTSCNAIYISSDYFKEIPEFKNSDFRNILIFLHYAIQEVSMNAKPSTYKMYIDYDLKYEPYIQLIKAQALISSRDVGIIYPDGKIQPIELDPKYFNICSCGSGDANMTNDIRYINSEI